MAARDTDLSAYLKFEQSSGNNIAERYKDLYDKLLRMDPVYYPDAIRDDQPDNYNVQWAELHSSFRQYWQKVIECNDTAGVRSLFMLLHKFSFPEAKKLLIESMLQVLLNDEHSLWDEAVWDKTFIKAASGLPDGLTNDDYHFGVLKQVVLHFSGSNLANTEFFWGVPIQDLFKQVVSQFVDMMDFVLDSKDPQGQTLTDNLLTQLYNKMIKGTKESLDVDYFGETEKIDILINNYQVPVSQPLLQSVFDVFMQGDTRLIESYTPAIFTLLNLVIDKNARKEYSKFMRKLVSSPIPLRSKSQSLPDLSNPSTFHSTMKRTQSSALPDGSSESKLSQSAFGSFPQKRSHRSFSVQGSSSTQQRDFGK